MGIFASGCAFAVLQIACHGPLAMVQINATHGMVRLCQGNRQMDSGGGFARPPLFVGEDDAMRDRLRGHWSWVAFVCWLLGAAMQR